MEESTLRWLKDVAATTVQYTYDRPTVAVSKQYSKIVDFYTARSITIQNVQCNETQTRRLVDDLRTSQCASGCVVECRTCNREVVGSNLGYRGLLRTKVYSAFHPSGGR